MITLTLNGESSKAMELISFNRNTSFENGTMNSYAYMTIVPTATTAANLTAYGLNGITHLLIKDGNDPIYTLTNINANLTSFDESLNGNEMNCSMNIRFNA